MGSSARSVREAYTHTSVSIALYRATRFNEIGPTTAGRPSSSSPRTSCSRSTRPTSGIRPRRTSSCPSGTSRPSSSPIRIRILQDHELSGSTSTIAIKILTLCMSAQLHIPHQPILQGSTGADTEALLLNRIVQLGLKGVHFFLSFCASPQSRPPASIF
jgi:hypothetical protein